MMSSTAKYVRIHEKGILARAIRSHLAGGERFGDNTGPAERARRMRTDPFGKFAAVRMHAVSPVDKAGTARATFIPGTLHHERQPRWSLNGTRHRCNR